MGDRPGQNLFDTVSNLKVMRPKLPIIVIGRSTDYKVMLNAIVSGAKGYVFDGASPSEFAQAIRTVSQGSIWAPRRVLSMFIELAIAQRGGMLPGANGAITDREKQVSENAGSGTFQQGNWGTARHCRANGQGTHCENDAQSWSAKPHCAFGGTQSPIRSSVHPQAIVAMHRAADSEPTFPSRPAKAFSLTTPVNASNGDELSPIIR